MTSKNSIIIHYPWYIHVSYWLLSIVIWVVTRLISDGEFFEPFINKLGYLPSQIIVTYFVLYYLLPTLLDRKYLRGVLGFGLMIYIAVVLARFMKIYFYETLIGFESQKETLIEILTETDELLVHYMIWVLMTPALTVIIVMILNHYRSRQRLAHLRNKKLQTELRFLKAQLHPHFLFNTLNNLYTLSLQKSPNTADIAQRLYDMLDYMFHRGEEHMVTISEELNLIYNYIELEKLRYGDRLQLIYNVEVDNKDQLIVPLMFLSIVENAFKHGVSGDIETPKIDIFLKECQGQLTFSVHNSKAKYVATDKTDFKKGIGIENIKRQLTLVYPNNYSYEISETPDAYQAEVIINLNGVADKFLTSQPSIRLAS